MRTGSPIYKILMALLAVVFTFSSCGAPVAIEQQIQSAAQEKATTDQLTTLSATSRSSITKQPKVQQLIKTLEAEGIRVRYDRVQEKQTEDGSTAVAIELSNSNSIDLRFLSILIKDKEVVYSALNHFSKNAEEVRGQMAEVLKATAVDFTAIKVDGKAKITSFKRGHSLSSASSMSMLSVVESKTASTPGQLGAMARKCQNEEENLNVALGWLAASAVGVWASCVALPWLWWACGAALASLAAAQNGANFASNQLDRCRGTSPY